MKFLRIKTIATAALVFTTTAMGSGLLTVPRAIAQTTGTLTVTANVGASCGAPDNTTLAFGSFDPLSLTPKDGETSITVRCLQDTIVSIDLGEGQNFASPRRRMAQAGSNANFLEYQLYTDPSRQNIWGTPAGGQLVAGLQGQGAVNPTRDPNATAAPVVYGRIFEGGNNQSAPVGDYSDTVTITVSF